MHEICQNTIKYFLLSCSLCGFVLPIYAVSHISVKIPILVAQFSTKASLYSGLLYCFITIDTYLNTDKLLS